MKASIQPAVITARHEGQESSVLLIEPREGRRPVQVLDAEGTEFTWLCADGITETLALPIEQLWQLKAEQEATGVLLFESAEGSENALASTPLAFFG